MKSYFIYALEAAPRTTPISPDQAAICHRATSSGSGCRPRLLCKVAAADRRSAVGRKKECIVAVAPNCFYAFSVAAFNGVHASPCGEVAPSVFVPARVPPPPWEPPVALLVDGGQTVELTWTASRSGGGLPLESFRIGILGPGLVGDEAIGDQEIAVQRELSISASEGVEVSSDTDVEDEQYTSPQVHRKNLSHRARLDSETLEAGMQYRFVLAACNRLGTGSWSRPSEPLWAPRTYCPIPARPLVRWQALDLVVRDISAPQLPHAQPCAFALCPHPRDMDEQQTTLPRIDSPLLAQFSRRE